MILETDIPSRSDCGSSSTEFRPSLYFAKNLKSGEIISSLDIRRTRIGFGLPLKHLDEIIG